MHLAELTLRNFRSCVDTTVRFEKDLTVLVGENNGGKTSVLDAIRLLTTPSDGRRTRYPEVRDVHRDQPDGPMRIDARFEQLSPTQKGWFLTALTSPTEDTAILGYEWTPPGPGVRRSRPVLTVGPRRSQDPEPIVRDSVRHVHLPALRDAARDLASSAPGRIEFLLRHLMGADAKTKEPALLKAAKDAFDGLMRADGTLQAASDRVAKEFNPLTDGFHPHEARLEFTDATLTGLARDLRFRLSQRGVDLAELTETGLGYANLLYLASVLVELAAAKDAELTLLLVEEPEAHLHPQLQAVTLDLLRRRARESQERTVAAGERAGRIQVIVTTHSPNLASSVPCSHVVVMRSKPQPETEPEATDAEGSEQPDEPEAGSTEGPSAEAADPEGPPTPRPRSPTTQAVAVSRLGIDGALLRKVDRYLDVTRSGMLFSRRVLLVEGLAEALLMPVFARQLFAADSPELNRFHGASVVAIDGVDFEPFVRLLLSPETLGGPTIAERLLVITDDDSAGEGDDEGLEEEELDDELDEGSREDNTVAAALGQTVGGEADAKREEEPKTRGVAGAGEGEAVSKLSAGERRKKAFESIARGYGVSERLGVFITKVTFEHALVEHCGDDADKLALVESACAKMNATPGWVKRRRKKFRDDVSSKTTASERAAAFMAAFVTKKFRKGDFAQLLAAEIEPTGRAPRLFGVPSHFADALTKLVELP